MNKTIKQEIELNNHTYRNIDKKEAEKLYSEGIEIVLTTIENNFDEEIPLYYCLKNEVHDLNYYIDLYKDMYNQYAEKEIIFYTKTLINKTALKHEEISRMNSKDLKEMFFVLATHAKIKELKNKYIKDIRNFYLVKNDYNSSILKSFTFNSNIRYRVTIDDIHYFLDFEKSVEQKHPKNKIKVEVSLLDTYLVEIIKV